MKQLSKLSLLAAVALVALQAQPQTTPAAADLFEKAPPDVDQALRSRITEFYQHHIDGTHRKAEKLVAEESQEFFYQAQKQRYDSCEMIKVSYAENFTRATATMACKGKWNINGNETKVTMPLSSSWKREGNGEWFWYHVIPKKMPTPFGEMDYGSEKDPTKAAPPKPSLGGGFQIPTDMNAASELLLKQVKVSKTEIQLSSYEKGADTIEVTNNSGGNINVKFEYEAIIPGFQAAFDRTSIEPGKSATLKLTMNPKDKVAKPTLEGRLLVEPLMRVFPVKITFAIPPELEKQLPKPLQKKK